MAINRLTICNFKGVKDATDFEIRPITLFIGPNSSGKSSCLHALTSLAQTVKLAQSKRPIILDDEYAQVHLGRFIEVIHSKSYSDAMQLGIALVAPMDMDYGKEKAFVKKGEEIRATYTFKSTKRTQEVFIEQCELVAGESALLFQRNAKTGAYSVAWQGKATSFVAEAIGGLKFSVSPFAKKNEQFADNYVEVLLVSEMLSQLISTELRNTLYLGPFRQSPLRRYPTRGASPAEVGSEGDAAITLLANEYVQSKSRAHKKQISAWLSTIGLAKSIDVSRVGTSDLFDVSVTLPDGVSLPIADLGYGVSQALPVLTQLSFASYGSTLLFEQPELHLHPAAAERLASVMIEAAKAKGLRIMAETHSRELFRQLMRSLKEGKIGLGEVAAYTVERRDEQSVFTRIEIEENDGHFEVYDPWEKGITQL